MRSSKGKAYKRRVFTANTQDVYVAHRGSKGRYTKSGYTVSPDYYIWKAEERVKEIRRFRFWWGLIIGFLLGWLI